MVLVSFDPSMGHEPRKQRPALVVSTTAANERMALAFVCPITSTDNGYPLHVPLWTPAAEGWVCCEQLRTLDLGARGAITIGSASQETMGAVLENLGAILGL